MHAGLKYHDSAKVVCNKRNVELFESPWLITNKTIQEMYIDYLKNNNAYVSKGTFYSLRPFYARSPTEKDIEMCVCKDHLHARWAVEAFLKLTKKQKITVDFCSYETFLSFLYSPSCIATTSSEYIKWTCTPDKKSLCPEIKSKFEELKNKLNTTCDKNIIVKKVKI